jgi:thiol-disulfide isomerase/thioredoxin
MVQLFASDWRDICRYLAAQELIGFKVMMTPEAFSTALPTDLSVHFSPAFQKTRHYRRLTAYYESEMRKVSFSVFRNLVLQDSTLKSCTLKMPDAKILVVDLWASWCKPCRHGNKTYLASIRQRFKPEDVAVVSISLDQKAEDWLKAMHQDGISWPSFLDTTGTDGKLALATGVVGLPRLMVFDQMRENVANDLAGELLLEFIRKLLPER